jgi:hypothetical protein
METLKKCTKCKCLISISEFNIDNSRYDKLKATCNKCSNINTKNWYANNLEKARILANNSYNNRKENIAKRRKELRAQNPEKYKENAKNTRLKNIVHYRNMSMVRGWKTAGILNMSIEIYHSLLKEQKECCAICNTHQSVLKKRLGVDHNHSTGKPRGLLCDACNRAIGYLKESKTLFTSALTYLEKND